MARRVVTLKGNPIVEENDKAAGVITPGDLVNWDASGNLIRHATATIAAARNFALEREEFGKGMESAATNIYSGSGDYAIGDVVKVGAFNQGMHVNAFIASGQNVAKGNRMESAGDGTLKVGTTLGACLAVALETISTVTVKTRLRVQIV